MFIIYFYVLVLVIISISISIINYTSIKKIYDDY